MEMQARGPPGAVCPRVRARVCSDWCLGPSRPLPSGPVAQRLPQWWSGARPHCCERDAVFGGALPWLCGAGGEKAGKRPPGSSPNPPGPPEVVRWGAGLAAALAAPSLSRQWGPLQGHQLLGNLLPGVVGPAGVCTPPPWNKGPPTPGRGWQGWLQPVRVTWTVTWPHEHSHWGEGLTSPRAQA